MILSQEKRSREELRGLQDSVNDLRLRCTILETENKALKASVKDFDAVKLQLVQVQAMLPSKDTEVARALAESASLHNALSAKASEVELKTREVDVLHTEINKLRKLIEEKADELASLEETHKDLTAKLQDEQA